MTPKPGSLTASSIKMSKKFPISALPLPPKSQRLTQNLTPDPETGTSPQTFLNVLLNKPSVQRKSRIVNPAAHFSRLTPLNLPFPYRIQPPEGREIQDKASYVEEWLSAYEPLDKRDSTPTPISENGRQLQKFGREKRDSTRDLIALSDSGLRDCLPNLDVGDAFAQIGAPSLASINEENVPSLASEEERAIREELIDVLSGQSVLMSLNENDIDSYYTPWSLRYSGHQFGNWAGQLGDGRAISILETPHPSDPELTYELQLKGAGRTPYARFADGLAVLRSSIREFLCSEAMHALRIPTSRSLSLVHFPDLPVARETIETACVLTRIAPSFIRIGSFEALDPPQSVFLLGGGQQPAHYDALRILGEWVSRNVLKLKLDEDAPWGKALVLECAKRNASMVAGWQVYGFMHGVINTDNVSIMGLTIDYGPYAFMDIFHRNHICNHTDELGRYSYQFQPTMIEFAIRALINALAPLIGAECDLGTRVKPGWADNASEDKIEEWRDKGRKIWDDIQTGLKSVTTKEHSALFRKRLGLRTEEKDDFLKLFDPLLSLMQDYKLDFHSTFRQLCSFRPSSLSSNESESTEELKGFIEKLAANSHEAKADDVELTKDWCSWLSLYAERIEKEVDSGIWNTKDTSTSSEKGVSEINVDEDVLGKRENEMRRANPRFVLRQWVLEEIIKRVEEDSDSGKRALAKVHEMAVNPFEAWGAEGEGRALDELSAEEKEERRFCGLGPTKFIGFQCNCSS